MSFLRAANVVETFSLKPLTDPLSGETPPSDAEGEADGLGCAAPSFGTRTCLCRFAFKGEAELMRGRGGVCEGELGTGAELVVLVLALGQEGSPTARSPQLSSPGCQLVKPSSSITAGPHVPLWGKADTRSGVVRGPAATLGRPRLWSRTKGFGGKLVPRVWQVFCVLKGCSYNCFITSYKAKPLYLHSNVNNSF